MPKSERQKIKLFYIADYLMRKTDADEKGNMLHGVLIKDIAQYLDEKGIEAEAHSIRRDIDLLRGGKDADFDPVLDIQGGQGRPIFIGNRFLPFEDLETIVECVASANFISRPEAEDLIEKLKDFCSEYQAETLTSEYIVAERPKYTEKKMLRYLRRIKSAIKNKQGLSSPHHAFCCIWQWNIVSHFQKVVPKTHLETNNHNRFRHECANTL